MSHSLPITAAGSHLPQLVAALVPGDDLILTDHGRPVAVVTPAPRTSWPCQPGTAKDRAFWMAPDFDAPLADFAEYME